MKQKFKGIELTKKKCVNSIVGFFKESTVSELQDGLKWYNEANDYCKELSSRFNITLSQAAGVIAVYSSQTGWAENKRYALTFLMYPKNRLKSLVQDIKAKNIIKLDSENKIFHALSVNGTAFKTKSFFLNIVNPDLATNVTIDRHAIAICLQKPDNVEALPESYGSNITKKQYDFFQQCYMDAAKELDILPHQLQAITWVTYRRLRELPQNTDNKHWQPFTTESF